MKENIEEVIEFLDGVDIKIFLSGMAEQSEYIVDKANEVNEAVELLLSDYKRLQEEFRQVDHECERLEQKELRLEKEIEELKKQNYDLLRKLKNRVKEVRKLEKYSMYKKEFSTLNKKVNELQKENEELKAERDGIYEDYQDLGKEKWSADEAILFLTERLENSIPKQKVKDKIEELNKKIASEENEKVILWLHKQRNVLQDLLEEKGE